MKRFFFLLTVFIFFGCAAGQPFNPQTGIITASKDCLMDSVCRTPIFNDVISAYKEGQAQTPPITPWLPTAIGTLTGTVALLAGLYKHYKESQAQRVIAATQILNAISTPNPPNIPVIANIK